MQHAYSALSNALSNELFFSQLCVTTLARFPGERVGALSVLPNPSTVRFDSRKAQCNGVLREWPFPRLLTASDSTVEAPLKEIKMSLHDLELLRNHLHLTELALSKLLHSGADNLTHLFGCDLKKIDHWRLIRKATPNSLRTIYQNVSTY